MNTQSILAAIFMMLLLVSSHAQPITKTVNRNTDFAFELFKETFKKDTSICLSPYSISFALSMAYAGTRNETKAQMSRVVHLDLDQAKSNDAFFEIQRQLNLFKGDTSIRLLIANAIWKRDGVNVYPEYVNVLDRYYHAQVFPITNAKAVNEWAKIKTNNKIDNIIDDATLSKGEVLLINAVYFKGSWLKDFDKQNTRKDIFQINANTQNTVDMMYQKSAFFYFEDQENQVIELPYKGNEISMVLILPKKESSIEATVANMNSQMLANYRYSLTQQIVQVFLPKFSFSSSFQLQDKLQQMGMTDPFTSNADFSGITSKGLFISKIAHQTVIDVNEKGSEAAAVTYVRMERSSNPKIYEFNANRPFLFFIIDKQTETVLFMGSVINPKEVNGKDAKVYTGPRVDDTKKTVER